MIGILKKLDALIKQGVFVMIAAMMIAVMVQVYTRTFMEQPPIWTEETSRVALLYILGLGVGASVLTGDLVNVDLALMLMPKKLKRFCELLSAALVAVFGLLMLPGAWEYTESGMMQTSPILEVQMHYVFASMLCFSVLLSVYGLVKFFKLLLETPAASSPLSGDA